MTVQKTYVTDGQGNFFVQLPDSNQWGFSLFDDELSWPGGFGICNDGFFAVTPDQVPQEDRDRLDWLFNADLDD